MLFQENDVNYSTSGLYENVIKKYPEESKDINLKYYEEEISYHLANVNGLIDQLLPLDMYLAMQFEQWHNVLFDVFCKIYVTTEWPPIKKVLEELLYRTATLENQLDKEVFGAKISKENIR